ncbi:MAG TPA: PfkB family carbohydrate kinase [Trebonia sp.]
MSSYDVIVLGEPLVEIATLTEIEPDVPATIGVSGDALNAAAAAAATGAQVALLALITDDELGDMVASRVRALGIDDALLRRTAGQQGMYLVHSDPDGQRQFHYARSGSVGSRLAPDDLPLDVIAAAGAVLASGITCALSDSARAAVVAAARRSRAFVYDPNFRPRLTTAGRSAATLAELAPLAALVTPSAPAETGALLGTANPVAAAARCRELGAAAAAVTCGSDGVLLAAGTHDGNVSRTWVPAVPAPAVIDQTGAGDVFAGTVTARLALGDPLTDAVPLGAAAASLAVGGQGGTGRIASLAEIRAHAGLTA